MMSKAPEWIYLDGDAKAGDGMFPRCFENPKYASEPPIEYGRIDLLEAAEQRSYASAMEAQRKLHQARIEELEAKLAKAVDVIDWALICWDDHNKHGYTMQGDWVSDARTTLAELKGEADAT